MNFFKQLIKKPLKALTPSFIAKPVTEFADNALGKYKDLFESVATSAILPNLPGDVGEFFASPIGQLAQTVYPLFKDSSGDSMNLAGLLGGSGNGGFGEFLSGLGLSGAQSDTVQEFLTLAALATLSNKFAKEALNRAKELQTQEKNLADSLYQSAMKLSDPGQMEMRVQKALEDVSEAHRAAAKQVSIDLSQRGLGRRTTGPIAALAGSEAVDRMKARRDIEMDYPTRALEAQSAALTPLSRLREGADTEAARQQKLIPDLYFAMKQANKGDPYAQALQAQNAAMQAQAGAETPAADSGVASGLQAAINSIKGFTPAQSAVANTLPLANPQQWIKGFGTMDALLKKRKPSNIPATAKTYYPTMWA